MTRILSIAFALAAFTAVPARAGDQPSHAISPEADFHLSHELLVGTTTLTPGEYKFQCVMFGNKEFLVVTNDEGREVARVPCRPEELQAKVELSDFRYMRNQAGVATLTAVRIRGEKIAHVVSE